MLSKLNTQLLGFSKLVSELATLAEQAEAGDESGADRPLLSARESKLSAMLTPILGGACKTHLLACARPDPVSYSETCSTLRLATKARSMSL